MQGFVRFAAIYNLGATLLLMVPPLYTAIGLPLDPVAAKLSGCLLLYTVPALWLASNDLPRLASLAYWDGVIRILVFISFLFHGLMVWGLSGALLAGADLVIGVTMIVLAARTQGRSHADLLLARAGGSRVMSAA